MRRTSFVFAALLFLAGWMIGNRDIGFDPYPFILLNLILSCLAAMQGAILLIAAKRADQIEGDFTSATWRCSPEAGKVVSERKRLLPTTSAAWLRPSRPIRVTTRDERPHRSAGARPTAHLRGGAARHHRRSGVRHEVVRGRAQGGPAAEGGGAAR